MRSMTVHSRAEPVLALRERNMIARVTCRASRTIWAKVTSSRDARRLVPKRSARRAPSPADPVKPTPESTHRALARSCEQPAPALSAKFWFVLSMFAARLSAATGLVERGSESIQPSITLKRDCG